MAAGRPRMELNEKLIFDLSEIHCTLTEMAHIAGCSTDTLRDNYSSIIEKGRSSGKMSLRRKQFEAANKGNIGMLIWLGKQLLEQSDRAHFTWEKVSDEEFAAEAERRLEIAKSA